MLKKVAAVKPSTESLPQREAADRYIYKVWPEAFNTDLFCTPRPIPKMISAEFNRQEVFVSRLRLANYKTREETESGDEVAEGFAEFFGADYSDSVEVAAFTIFFFTYSTLIGRDWQEFQKKRREMELKNLQTTPVRKPMETPIHRRGNTVASTQQDVAVVSATCSDDCYVAVCDECTGANIRATSSLPFMSPFPTSMYPDFKRFSLLSTTKKKPQNEPNSSYLTPNRSDSLVDHFDDSYVEYEEARAVAAAQLDLGFETLTTMSSLRNLAPDPDAYKSLMGACGRCGDTQRALELIEVMKKDGLVDGEVLSWFVSAFAHNDDSGISSRLSPANRDNVKSPHRGSDAYYRHLERKLDALEQRRENQGTSSYLTGLLSSDDDESVYSDSSTSSSVSSAPLQSSSFMEWFTPHKQKPRRKKKSKRRRKKSSLKIGMPVSAVVAKQIVLAENLLDFLYPSLSIDTNGDCCPQCSAELKESDIVKGWVPCAFGDYASTCPNCKHRFVPRFSVTNLAPDFQGSQGVGTPLHCEFLSPWVLRKELSAVAEGEGGIEAMTKPEWRSGADIHSTLWWNLIVLCRKYKLPYSYLLQGSFQNRLISPTP